MLKVWKELLFPMYHEADDDKSGDPPKADETPVEDPPKKSPLQVRIDKLTAGLKEQRDANAALLLKIKEADDKKLTDNKQFEQLSKERLKRIEQLEAELNPLVEFKAAEVAKQKTQWESLKDSIPEKQAKYFRMDGDSEDDIAHNLAKHEEFVEVGVFEKPPTIDTDTTNRLSGEQAEVDEHNPLSAQIEKEAENL